MEIIEAATVLYPGTTWNMRGNQLEQAQDGGPRIVPDMAQIQAICASVAYKDFRTKEYPPIGDQLDAIWKGGKDFDDMKNKILSIKAKYPKP